jgi:thiamine pyrophosphate-dependent acetolactate synthase large subunit-like protein
MALIGNGAIRTGSTEAVKALVEFIGAPFATTIRAKGPVSDEHLPALAGPPRRRNS